MSYRRQLFTGVNSVVNPPPTALPPPSSSSPPCKDLPEFNIAILGALAVGKSALTVKYITKRFIMEYDPDIEDTYTKVESIDSQDIRVKIMDTCDNDNERKSPDRYLKWAHAFVVVYSVTSRASYDEARSYLDTVAQYQRITGKDIPVAVVGNKMDLERYRTVSRNSGEDLALHFESLFYETSAADDYESVEQVFVDIIREMARVHDRQMPLQALFISEDRSAAAALPYRRYKPVKPPATVAAAAPSEHVKKDSKDESKLQSRRTAAPFKFFNKGFKIFN